MEPINYLQQVADPFAQALQGYKLSAGIVDIEAKRAQTEKQQQQLQLAMQEQAKFFANPNPTMRDALQFAAVLPKDRADALRPYIENFSKEQQQNVLKANGQILSALQVNPETGIKMLQDYATAQRNSGDQEEAALYDRLAEAAADPARGPAMAFKSLVTVTSRIPGAKEMFETIDKASTTAQSQAEAPAALTKKVADAEAAVADAKKKADEATDTPARLVAEQELRVAQAEEAKVKANFAGPLAQANLNLNAAQIKNINSEISNRASKLNLDVQTMQATVAEKLSSIQKNMTELPADTRKLVNDSAVAAAASKQSANQYNDLAKRLDEAGGGYGAATSFVDYLRKQTGAQNALTNLRQEYTRVRNSAAIKSLPPGVATDKDIELALKGIPPENADARTVASFLRGLGKMQDIEASVGNAKTDWLANNNGVLTRAKDTFIAGDYTTKPGETFNDFTQRVVSDVSKRYRSPAQKAEEDRLATMAKIPTTETAAAAPAPVNIRAEADAILRRQ